MNERVEEDTDIHTRYSTILKLFDRIFEDDIRFSILKFLSKRDGTSVEEIAKNVGMSHKSLINYLDNLVEKGALEVTYTSSNARLYQTCKDLCILKDILNY